jgi:hypothetical protein
MFEEKNMCVPTLDEQLLDQNSEGWLMNIKYHGIERCKEHVWAQKSRNYLSLLFATGRDSCRRELPFVIRSEVCGQGAIMMVRPICICCCSEYAVPLKSWMLIVY